MKTDHFMLENSDWVPNNPNFSVVVYRQIGPYIDSAALEALFSANGWTGVWRNGVFDYHHYHSGAHEVLGIGCGDARLQIGGPDGTVLEVSQGDCLILPAGTGHKRIESSPDFQVVGAYPPEQKVDIQRSAPTEDMLARITSCPKPDTDPVHGSSAGLNDLWQRT
ncbi:cupin [Agrobacterium rubi]|uniref:Cupin n=1 Tax=Agrobacterium rubi TaxID=28099 RepID=A0AAE7UPR0_9HYPH|nr:cupin [Agrobacterium rubi]NTE88350.1 cupin [Agrobacterium rubi]NTF04116.1 cupin [Agrobacterium rubi]NTF09530.1 cupin [Agrobacterium rubi]NTF22437.1 cupin [Agrobacterium rubi]NTF29294.1 cupin [Agrobacterium rubi]